MQATARPLSAPTAGALLALALATGGSLGGTVADRDRPLPRWLPAPAESLRPTGAGEAEAGRLARAVFGVG
jgi:hypothetical protein